LVGDYARSFETYGIKGLLDKYNIAVETKTMGENKAKLNSFADLPEKDRKW